jgi:hypothetical protein
MHAYRSQRQPTTRRHHRERREHGNSTHTHIHTYIHTGLKDNLQPDDTIERDVSVDPQELISSLKEILSMGVQHLEQWLQSPEAGINVLQSGDAYVPVPYVVQSQPVSLRESFYTSSAMHVPICVLRI